MHTFNSPMDNSIHPSGAPFAAPRNSTSRHAYSSSSDIAMPASFHPSVYHSAQPGLMGPRTVPHTMSGYDESHLCSYKAVDPAAMYEMQNFPPESYSWPQSLDQYMMPESFTERSYSSLDPPSSTQTESSDAGISRPTLLSWPVEYFVTSDPSLVSSHAEVITDAYGCWTSTGSSTPELLYTSTSSSCDESANVFDLQFGDAIDSSSLRPNIRGYPDPQLLPRRGSNDSSASSSPSPLHELSRRSPNLRTPSPSSDFGASTPASDHRRRFPCLLTGCSRRFTSQYTLKVHMEAHKPKPKVTFPCTQGCSERFSRQHDRLRHEVAKHGKVCEFSCDECGRFFSTSKTLGNHKCPLAPGGTRWVHV